MPKKNQKFWQFRAKQDNEVKEGELLLYGDISSSTWWGDEVTPKQFKQDLDDLGDISTLNIYINSGGGDVFAGLAIYSMLKRHQATKKVYVDGLAASIASVIAMAGDVVYMPKNAMMMIHKAWTYGLGNANDFRKLADDMDKIDESILVTYEAKTGLEKEKIIEMVNAETWMTAEEALAYGFADEIEKSKQLAAAMRPGQLIMNGLTFDLSRYRNPPNLEGQVANALSVGVQNEGRTLSSVNEQRIRQASDLLNEVLDQLGDTGEGQDSARFQPSLQAAALVDTPTTTQETRQVPVDLYIAQIQINRRRLAHV
ncbi:head maturation protease, ClpP-related [Paradesulfitobacterium ferrireducens]|uniref:head maturation protease, ClpP-related n=1 Tax=Paradesulfitobacterium ferrireducens TaxID=2816476 RepID=UPI001A8D5339|nr:head maturation protease, ClpP-related [Paradesulfitobacterium ferrireducens]